jgi:hypothetical protein
LRAAYDLACWIAQLGESGLVFVDAGEVYRDDVIWWTRVFAKALGERSSDSDAASCCLKRRFVAGESPIYKSPTATTFFSSEKSLQR